jgi:hypothetical protein
MNRNYDNLSSLEIRRKTDRKTNHGKTLLFTQEHSWAKSIHYPLTTKRNSNFCTFKKINFITAKEVYILEIKLYEVCKGQYKIYLIILK